MKLHLLAFAAHPDDAEISCGGTLIKHVALGYQVGIVDLTRGQLGTRGNADLRLREAEAATSVLGIHKRLNLGFEDGYFVNDKDHQLEVIRVLRAFQPDIVLCNARHDRHPDHGRAAAVVVDACFLAGLPKIETYWDGQLQSPWRPAHIFHYMQAHWHEPRVLIDVSRFWDQRMQAVRCFRSQFYDPESTEPVTYIAQPQFLDLLTHRARVLGDMIGVEYAENFVPAGVVGIEHFYVLQ